VIEAFNVRVDERINTANYGLKLCFRASRCLRGKVVEFVFNRRIDNTALIYEVQISTDVVHGEPVGDGIEPGNYLIPVVQA
jgi:hypothetical protein